VIVAIDPGVKVLGWAAFLDSGALVDCGISRTKARDLSAALAEHVENMREFSPAVVALESMRYTPGRRTTPQDLIDVQTIGVGVASALGPVRLYPPSAWKGSIPKDVHHARTRAALEPEERERLGAILAQCPKINRKEILDAVGIGLYHLKRTNRSGGSRA